MISINFCQIFTVPKVFLMNVADLNNAFIDAMWADCYCVASFFEEID
jgi:hypothetical protein